MRFGDDILLSHGPPLHQIDLIANNADREPLGALILDFLEPAVQTLKTAHIGHIEG